MKAKPLLVSGLVMVASLASMVDPVWAMDDTNKEALRVLANDALTDFDAKRYSQAKEKFQRAYDTAKLPRLAVWLAKTNEKLGNLVSAYELYRQASSLEKSELWVGTVQQQAQEEARKLLAALQPRIPKLAIHVEGADPSAVTVKVDDVIVPNTLLGVERYADPGQRRVVGQLGAQVVEQSLLLAEGGKEQVVLRFKPNAVAATDKPSESRATSSTNSTEAKSSGSWQKTAGWVAIGVGTAGLVLGVTTGIMVATRARELKDNCPEARCEPDYWSKVDTFETLRKASVAGFIVGGVGAAAGITLLLTSPKQATPTVGVWFMPNGAGVRGEF
jgi:hypothetical protein